MSRLQHRLIYEVILITCNGIYQLTPPSTYQLSCALDKRIIPPSLTVTVARETDGTTNESPLPLSRNAFKN